MVGTAKKNERPMHHSRGLQEGQLFFQGLARKVLRNVHVVLKLHKWAVAQKTTNGETIRMVSHSNNPSSACPSPQLVGLTGKSGCHFCYKVRSMQFYSAHQQHYGRYSVHNGRRHKTANNRQQSRHCSVHDDNKSTLNT